MKRLLIVILLFCACFVSYAQNDVVLVVSGEGETKTSAVTNALRSAIEQAFGTFVSANTEILNDEIVKDEVATVSSGNIKKYKELSAIQNGSSWLVSLEAQVSVDNLVSYAKTHGSSTEFAGQVWSMNMKMRRLNAENERLALEAFISQFEKVVKESGLYDIAISVDGNPTKISCKNYYGNDQEFFGMRFTMSYAATANTSIFQNALINLLESISLSSEEVSAYIQSNEPFYQLSFFADANKSVSSREFITKTAKKYYLRNQPDQFIEDLENLLNKALYSTFLLFEGANLKYTLSPISRSVPKATIDDRDYANYYSNANKIAYSWTRCYLSNDSSTHPVVTCVQGPQNRTFYSERLYQFSNAQRDRLLLFDPKKDLKAEDLCYINIESLDVPTRKERAYVMQIANLFTYSSVGSHLFDVVFDFPFTEELLSKCTNFSVIPFANPNGSLAKSKNAPVPSSATATSTKPSAQQQILYCNAYDGYVNIRSEASSKSAKVGRFDNGPQGAELLEKTTQNWWKINVNGVVGYVNKAYLQSTPTEALAPGVTGDFVTGKWNAGARTLTILSNGKYIITDGPVTEEGKWRLSGSSIVLVKDNLENSYTVYPDKNKIGSFVK